jgi:two-component system, NarL family, nitrate/nitrite response regulator NarL
MRLLLADDHPMIRTAIEVLLRDTAYEIVGATASGDETLAALGKAAPDILLLDLQMPDGTGMDVLRQLRSKGGGPRVVILTAAIDDSSLLEARSLGVSGMVLKSSDPAYIIECLDRVSRGGQWIDPELAERVQELSDAYGASGRPTLAPRERQLVRFVSQGLRNRDIAQRLGVTEGTVKVYLHAVFDKLRVSNRTELAIRADEFLAESYLKK